MSAFFGNIMSSLQTAISATSVSVGRSATTSTITASATNTGGGTLTYSWTTTGTNCTINSQSAASTTLTGLGVSGTTNLYCNIKNSVTGTIYSSPSCFITWTTTAPTAPTIGSSSSGDKSFTINWTAPTDDGGSAITGYYVQNSTNGGTSWSTPILVGVTTSYNWSGNTIIYNGNSYIGRVAAVNSIGTGTYSGNSSGQTPTFAAPSCSVTGQAGYPSTSDPLRRPLTVTINPTACVDYNYTQVYILSNPFQDFPAGQYSSYVQTYSGGPGVLFITNSSAAGQTGNVYSIYQQNLVQGTQYWNTVTNNTYSVYVITYNNDGYGVQSGTASFTTDGNQYSPSYTAAYSAATGTFIVTGNTFQQISTYAIPDSITQITSLSIEGWVVVTGINICSVGRNFVVYFSGATTGTFSQSNNCNSAPFTNNSGLTHQNKAFAVTATGYNVTGAGKIRVNGGGTIGTWSTSPDQRIRVVVNITGQTQQPY
jgi:hypothetical protein